MPRSLLEILLEKKDPKKSLPYPTRDQFNIELAALEKMCFDNLSELFGTENFGGVNTFGTIRDQFKDCKKTLEKYRLEWKDYPWNDPTVQKGLVTQKKIIDELIIELKKARIESLGEEDSYRIANTYFETGESLRVSGTQKILKIASMRDKEIKVDRSKANTDLTQNNELNKDLMDITAKKVAFRPEERPKDMSDADWENRKKEIAADNKKIKEDNDERKITVARTRLGMFYYLAMIVNETALELKEKWGGGDDGEGVTTDDHKKYRKEILTKAMPFIEKVTQKDFDDTNPGADEEYMKYVQILGSYTPGFKNYKPDPKDEEVEVKITETEYITIGTEMKTKKDKINDLIDEIIKRHPGNGPIDKIIKDEMGEAKNELNSVDPKTACDVNSKNKLSNAKEKLKDKVNDNKKFLDPKDITDLEMIADIIDEIFSYCANKSYIKEVKK